MLGRKYCYTKVVGIIRIRKLIYFYTFEYLDHAAKRRQHFMIDTLSNLIHHLDFGGEPRNFNHLLDVLECEQLTILIAECQLSQRNLN
jgi:hypothetical protein